MVDIYFEPKYGKLYESIEKGKSVVFKYEGDYGKIQHMFIKREIPVKVDDKTYYDLVTPYGYGGPIILECESGFKDELIHGFEAKFRNYCLENNIVSEFIRFHPIIKNHIDFKKVYEISYVRNTVATKITTNEDPMIAEFSKSARKTIRRSLRAGVTYNITRNPNNIKHFMDIYYSTMDRNKASNYYYFDKDYFEQCIVSFSDNILIVEAIYEDIVIAMGFYFVFNDMIHAHLSGTLAKYLKLSPAYIIKYATAQWAKENNIKLIHYGGGTSNSEEDPLYKFKKRFTKNTEFKFFIGKQIWNETIYNKLCNINNVSKKTDFFPAYRKNNFS